MENSFLFQMVHLVDDADALIAWFPSGNCGAAQHLIVLTI
jgi:hypothetical protein